MIERNKAGKVNYERASFGFGFKCKREKKKSKKVTGLKYGMDVQFTMNDCTNSIMGKLHRNATLYQLQMSVTKQLMTLSQKQLSLM